MVSKEEIPTYLHLIDELFGIERILSDANDTKDTIEYYRTSHIAYKFLHSRQGAVHMALSTDGSFSKKDYEGQPAYIGETIRTGSFKRILELGSGNGYNAIWLANTNPDVEFTGVDLTPIHIKDSKKHSGQITNLQFIQADFENTRLNDYSNKTTQQNPAKTTEPNPVKSADVEKQQSI
jgi:arsenite methyltransferase